MDLPFVVIRTLQAFLGQRIAGKYFYIYLLIISYILRIRMIRSENATHVSFVGHGTVRYNDSLG